MNGVRVIIAITGILLPYLVRIPRGSLWVAQYTNISAFGYLFFGAFNAIAWGSVIAWSFLYRRAFLLIFPAVFTFGFLGYMHYRLDLAADPQAAIGVIFIPIYSIPFSVVGGVIGYFIDRRLKNYDKTHPSDTGDATPPCASSEH
jgi:hypothetical protein